MDMSNLSVRATLSSAARVVFSVIAIMTIAIELVGAPSLGLLHYRF
jgi:hypothetical protein